MSARARRGPAADTFAQAVKEELCALAVGGERQAEAELHGLIRAIGSLLIGGTAAGGLVCEVRADRAPVARRAYRLFRSVSGARPVLGMRATRRPGGGRFVCRLPSAREPLTALGLLDRAGRPSAHIPARLRSPRVAPALLRGFFLGAGSVDDPGRDHHLELEVADEADEVAQDLITALGALGAPARATTRRRRLVVYVKDGEAIAGLLGTMGAPTAMLAYEEQRVRRHMRSQVNRLVNADTANIHKAAEAGLAQVADIQTLRAAGVLARLPRDLRAVAEARLSHPEASLRELGELCDPPLGKSSVQRRMEHLRRLAAGEVAPPEH